jgi:aminoglycoside phosphotransferase (APT) family kinase protein
MRIPAEAIPPGIQLINAEKNSIAETNNVYRCEGKKNSRDVSFYMKVGKTGHASMKNEYEVLNALAAFVIPAPHVLWYEQGRREYMALEELPGRNLSDLLNPRHADYEPLFINRLLRRYGEVLAEIHELAFDWRPFGRSELYGLIGDEAEMESIEAQEILLWLEANPPLRGKDVFVHGDLNTANILFHRLELSGLIDWEFAGMGWREYDLAWILRQRKNYMNTAKERESLLNGYLSKATFDPQALRWCEVLNYLHISHWAGDRFPAYRTFSLEKARQMMFDGF